MKIDHGLLLVPPLHFSASLPPYPFPGFDDPGERNGQERPGLLARMLRMLKPGLPVSRLPGAQRFILRGRQVMTGYTRPRTFSITNFQSN